MKLTISNFKAIEALDDFELSPVNILSGTNSCGKSSLIQLLLLFKQTLESDDNSKPLILNKPYVSLGKYKNIIFDKQYKNRLRIKFTFKRDDFSFHFKGFFRRTNSVNKIKEVTSEFTFSYVSNKLYVQSVNISYIFEDLTLWITFNRSRGSIYHIEMNSSIFDFSTYKDVINKKQKLADTIEDEAIVTTATVLFEKFFPVHLDGDIEDDFLFNFSFSPVFKNVFILLKEIFKGVSYLGPLREEPRFMYLNDEDTYAKVGPKGQFSAHILTVQPNLPVINYEMKESNDVISYHEVKSTLLASVKYWMCDVFQMANDISPDKKVDNNIISLLISNKQNLKVPINHVGFGISQILPVIIEGMRMKPGGILILEQPEIHLHPKVQSLLYDFLYSLSLSGKKILIETHSDHLITRLRRRVSESDTDISSKVQLVFVENDEGINHYNKLELNNMGLFPYWPKDFISEYDKDIRFIVKNQAMKRLKK